MIKKIISLFLIVWFSLTSSFQILALDEQAKQVRILVLEVEGNVKQLNHQAVVVERKIEGKINNVSIPLQSVKELKIKKKEYKKWAAIGAAVGGGAAAGATAADTMIRSDPAGGSSNPSSRQEKVARVGFSSLIGAGIGFIYGWFRGNWKTVYKKGEGQTDFEKYLKKGTKAKIKFEQPIPVLPNPEE